VQLAEEAERHFQTALAVHRRMESPHWIALTQLDYADFLADRSDPEDRQRATQLASEAIAAAEKHGFAGLMARAGPLVESICWSSGSGRTKQDPLRAGGQCAGFLRVQRQPCEVSPEMIQYFIKLIRRSGGLKKFLGSGGLGDDRSGPNAVDQWVQRYGTLMPPSAYGSTAGGSLYYVSSTSPQS
jgi:hypothetical protein